MVRAAIPRRSNAAPRCSFTKPGPSFAQRSERYVRFGQYISHMTVASITAVPQVFKAPGYRPIITLRVGAAPVRRVIANSEASNFARGLERVICIVAFVGTVGRSRAGRAEPA